MAVLKRVPLSVWLKLTFVVLIVGIVVYLISSIKTVVTTTNTTVPDVVKNEKIDVTPTMIRSIEQIGEWSFLEINDEELVTPCVAEYSPTTSWCAYIMVRYA